MTVAVYNSVDRIIRMAMFDAGLIEEGADPTSDQLGNYLQRLMDLIQVWQLEGCKLHLIQDILLPLVLNQYIYTVGVGGSINMPKPLRLEDAYFTDSKGGVRNIDVITRNEWDRLPPPQNNGTVTQIFEDRQISPLRFYLWNKPGAQDVAGSFHLVLRTIAGAGTFNTTDAITNNFPIEWAMALRWGLAMDICTGQPDSIVARCEKMATYYKTLLENYDVEQGGITFQPDSTQGVGFRSRFS